MSKTLHDFPVVHVFNAVCGAIYVVLFSLLLSQLSLSLEPYQTSVLGSGNYKNVPESFMYETVGQIVVILTVLHAQFEHKYY